MTADDPSPATNVTGRVRPARHLEHALDSRGIGRIRVGQPPTHRPPSECQRCAGKCPRIVHIDGGCQIREESFVVGDQVRLARKKRRDIAMRDVIEEGDEFVPNSIATESRICIRFIDSDSDATEPTQFVGLGAAKREERFLRRTAHARDTVGARPAHEVEKYCFSLVVGGVAGEDSRWKGSETNGPGACFEVGAIVEGDSERNELDSESIADFSNERCLCRRPGSQAVVDMVRGWRQTCGNCENQKCHRVGTPRHCTRHGSCRGEVGAGEKVADELGLANAERHLTLTAPRVARRADLLHIASNDSDECPTGCDGEDDTDPPVPRVRSNHALILAIRARS